MAMLASLGGDEEERAGGNQGEGDEHSADGDSKDAPVAEDDLRIDRVHRARHLGAGSHEQVAQDDPAGGEGQRDRHVEHGPLRVGDARLAQDLHAVRYGLDSGIGPAAERVGAHHDEGEGNPADLRRRPSGVADGRAEERGELEGVRGESRENEEGMHPDEEEEDRDEDGDALLDASQIEDDEGERHDYLGREFEGLPARRQQAEDLVAARRDRYGDRQYVVDDERAAGENAELRSEELGCDEVAAAACREEFDDLAVGERDEKDGDGGQARQPDGQINMASESTKGFFRPVCGGREPVRAEAYPGEKRGEGDAVEDPGIHGIPCLANEDVLDCCGQCFRRRGPIGPIMFLAIRRSQSSGVDGVVASGRGGFRGGALRRHERP
jgi:hypothetical protein